MERTLALAQISLAFFYGLIFVGMFVVMALFWESLSKIEIGLLTMFATGAMQQSKDAGNYFFARQRASTPEGETK
jgi:hypothetical protein